MTSNKATTTQRYFKHNERNNNTIDTLTPKKPNTALRRVYTATPKKPNDALRLLPNQPVNPLEIKFFENPWVCFSLIIESFTSKQTKFGKPMKPEKKYPNAFFSDLAYVDYSHTYLPGILTAGAFDGVGKQYSEAEKKQFKVYGDAGGLYQINNNNKKYIADNVYRYIVSPKGGLYIFTNEIDNCFHNAMRASQPVQCAGMVWINNNQISSIDNASGHYLPTEKQLLRTIDGLYTAGFLNSNVNVKTCVESPSHHVRMKDMGTIKDLINEIKDEEGRRYCL